MVRYKPYTDLMFCGSTVVWLNSTTEIGPHFLPGNKENKTIKNQDKISNTN